MDIHRNNAFSITAMEVAFNEGEEWLEQLLPYISANFDFVVDYCKQHIPKIRTYATMPLPSCGWTAGSGPEQRSAS